jgi:hypothetical protein
MEILIDMNLSPDWVAVFGRYNITAVLLAIPGLLERVKQNQTTSKTHYTNWRTLRSDV